jgi:acyl-homoserine-lactone acylase
MPIKKILFFIFLSGPTLAQPFTQTEITAWQAQAAHVTIIRDTWGVPHVYGQSDADAVFGMLYAQCEDDFERVERNYINTSGRQAEAEGEAFLFHDLRMRLFIDTTQAIKVYQQSEPWMKKLCQAFADGINFYLVTHPQVKPKLLQRFQPWMPFLFSEGSIGGDIESVSVNELKEFYGKLPGDLKETVSDDGAEPEPRGSNGFAIAPSRTADGKALLLINPHTSFYFRTEIQVSSEEGLNTYGAVTWGQFFIYQGFNAHCGWMHTSSAADVIDEYRESVVKKRDSLFYRYGNSLKFLRPEKIVIACKEGKGISRKEFTIYRTGHGPVIAQRGGKWISVRMMQEPLKALAQSYLRTKAATIDEFKKVMLLRTNSSNNTVYADDKGNIAYWHGNFMPRRDTQFDWSKPVDGSNPATEWKGLHTADEMIHLENPANGWIQNCNSTPFTAAAENSPDPHKYPVYMAPDAQNARGIHAELVLTNEKAFTLDKLITAAYDSYLTGFEKLLPALLAAADDISLKDSLKRNVAPAIQLLRDWDLRFSTASVPTTIAIYWAQKLRQNVSAQLVPGMDQLSIIGWLQTKTSAQQKMQALGEALADLQQDFGSWQQPWGNVNRFQRLTGTIDPVFDDSKPSIAVPFTSSFWGSLAAFGSRRYPGTKRMYGNVGNSFVAVVEFGNRIKAKSIVTGGENSNPLSSHFTDQAGMYCKGRFKDILFYRDDVIEHQERTYRPGE